jgi:serine protease SohB
VTEFLAEYGLFLAKVVTVVAALGVLIALMAAAQRKGGDGPGLKVDNLNDRYRRIAARVRKAVLSKEEFKTWRKAQKAAAKSEARAASDRPRTFVIDFRGDLRASAVTGLREEVTAVLSTAREGDEVLVRLENFGGLVHEHGLGASQLLRLRERDIPLTVAVDKAAASGGYMMACVANRIVAAPFAVIGSIGVLAQIPNVHRYLDERGVSVEQIKAGRYKRTVTMFGENTEADRTKLREELEDVHGLFKGLIAHWRPGLDIEAVATGEHWYGQQARELGLVDELGTSDDLLLARSETRNLFQVSWQGKKTLAERLTTLADSSSRGAADALWARLAERRHSG